MKKQNTAKAEAEEQLFESLYSADYDADGEYREIEIKHLDSFDYFPFHVYTEQQLELMAASIVRNGVITPIIVRPRKDGTSYQIISGHHRVDACRRLEMPTVPCIIRELSDQDALLCYIDSNLRQRRDLTPSEKAEAYKLMQKAWDEKKASGAPMEHRKIRDLIGKECGDSGAQVQRYLRLNYLIEPLQKKVDNGTISMRASYLTKAEQETLRTAVLKEQIAPTEKQAKKIRALSEQKRCTLQNIRTVLCTKDADFESAAKPELPEAEIIPLKPQEEKDAFCALDADIAVVAAYGLLLPKVCLEAFQYGCINIHGSLLPRWRGAAPIQRALLDGKNYTGVTVFRLAKAMDAGDILAQKRIDISANDSASTLYESLAEIGSSLAAEALSSREGLAFTPQDDSLATYAPKLDKKDFALTFSMTAEKFSSTVKALDMSGGAYIMIRGKRVKIWRASVRNDLKSDTPGQVLECAENLVVSCSDCGVELAEVQSEGKNKISGQQWARGIRLKCEDIL